MKKYIEPKTLLVEVSNEVIMGAVSSDGLNINISSSTKSGVEADAKGGNFSDNSSSSVWDEEE